MTTHEYQSKPVTITAVQIADDVDTTVARITDAFGDHGTQNLRINTDQQTDSEGGPRRVESVMMTTLQGALATAKPGEWIGQESDPDRFYPIADAAFRTRYKVPKAGRGVSVVVDGGDPQPIRDALR